MDFQAALKDRNLNVTPVRLAVFSALEQQPHSEAAQVFETVQKTLQSTSIQAVYNNLNALVAHGLIREIKPKGMASLYETRTGDNHHHLVCRHCGLVRDTDCLEDAPCLSSSDPQHFAIDEAEIIFWGLCPSCQKQSATENQNHEYNR